jgi:hypothetical protein
MSRFAFFPCISSSCPTFLPFSGSGCAQKSTITSTFWVRRNPRPTGTDVLPLKCESTRHTAYNKSNTTRGGRRAVAGGEGLSPAAKGCRRRAKGCRPPRVDCRVCMISRSMIPAVFTSDLHMHTRHASARRVDVQPSLDAKRHAKLLSEKRREPRK